MCPCPVLHIRWHTAVHPHTRQSTLLAYRRPKHTGKHITVLDCQPYTRCYVPIRCHYVYVRVCVRVRVRVRVRVYTADIDTRQNALDDAQGLDLILMPGLAFDGASCFTRIAAG